MKKAKILNPIAGFGGKTIDLVKFNALPEKEQNNLIKTTLQEIYQDHLKVNKKLVVKVIKLTWNPKDDYIYLPYNLKVTKDKLNLNFKLDKRKAIGMGWVIFMIWLFIFSLIGATYAGITFSRIADLNKDIDGDGIPDINIDINNDYYPDINIDINGNDKPDVNIDYKSNRRAVFNIDTDADGFADKNLVNLATDKDAKCKINCDTNGDGWPDLNLDLDGDGLRDIDIDTDDDGVMDLNIDITGDGVCDVMCDTDGDELCDENCIYTSEPGKPNGSSTVSGDPNVEASTPLLLINYVDGITVNIHDLLPDDQPDIPFEQEKPKKIFTIENMSDYPIVYSLKWHVSYNTFISSNFKYKIEATNGGYEVGYTTAPTSNVTIIRNIRIPARVSQKYTVSFNLVGTGAIQNEDQGRVFQGYLEIEL